MNIKNRTHQHNNINFIIGISLYFTGIVLYVLGFFLDPFLAIVFNLIATAFAGYEVILEGLVHTVQNSFRSRSFKPSIHLLMTLGAVGAIIIGEYSEAALLIIIFASAHYLEEYAQNKSKREILSLIKLNPTKARLIKDDDSIEVVEVSRLKIGDRLKVLNGDQVPTDGIILSGRTTIDQASITGESIPVEKSIDDEVYGATINGEGTFTMEVSKNNNETVFAKILQLVKEAQTNISRTAAFIKKLEPIYVTIVLIVAPLFYLMGAYLLKWDPELSFYRTMVLLIGASPCALAVTDIPSTLSAISNLARNGVLFKGGSYLSNFNDIDTIAFDKTGTLTMGKPVVTDVYFIAELSEEAQLELIGLVLAMEEKSNHPLAKAILNHYNQKDILDLDVENVIGVGLKARHNENHYQISKPGAFDDVQADITEIRSQFEGEGKTVMFVAKNGVVNMIIAVLDQEKPSAKAAIAYFHGQNIHTVLITGDTLRTGQAIGKKLGIDEIRAEILPAEKAQIIIDLKKDKRVVAMVGDGVNDAPALVHADIGIAMGEGTDIAIEVSDVVLMKNDLSKIVYTHKVAKKLRRIIWQNIIFAMGVVLLLMVVNVLGLINMTWAVFVHEGSTVLVLINGLRLLKKI